MDKAYTTPNGETRYRHITSGQAKLASKQKWERTVARARREKALAENGKDYEVIIVDAANGNERHIVRGLDIEDALHTAKVTLAHGRGVCINDDQGIPFKK